MTTEAGVPVSQVEPPPDFADFVHARSTALLRTAMALTGDLELAQDLLQTSLAQTWRSWDRMHTSHEAFARRTMVNTYVSWWRRKWNGERPTADLPERASAGHDAEMSMDLLDAVGRLPRRQRAVIVLRYYEDLPDAEIAEILGCSPSTVRSQAHRALARLADSEALQEDASD